MHVTKKSWHGAVIQLLARSLAISRQNQTFSDVCAIITCCFVSLPICWKEREGDNCSAYFHPAIEKSSRIRTLKKGLSKSCNRLIHCITGKRRAMQELVRTPCNAAALVHKHNFVLLPKKTKVHPIFPKVLAAQAKS